MALSVHLGNFYGVDSVMDLLIAFVAGLVSWQSRRIYKLVGDKKYGVFSWSFLFIAIAYALKIISNLTLVHRFTVTHPNFIISIVHEFNEMQYVHFVSFVLYQVAILLGFLMLFLLATKTFKRENLVLFSYLGVAAVLLSIYFEFVFYLTLVLLLVFLAGHFYSNYKKRRSKHSLMTFLAFAFILLGNTVDIFYGFDSVAYLIGEIIIFLGFSVLFLNHFWIKNGQKKNTA